MNHDCKEPYAGSIVVMDDSIKLWRFAVTDHHYSEPVSYCPFCGDKLPFEISNMDKYRDGERSREEDAKKKHESLVEHMRNNPSPPRDDDEIPEHNPLIKSP